MAILPRQDETENDRLLDDGADHLRADILGSIVGSDPRRADYLGRINNLITAHGAVGKKPEMTPPASVPGGDPGMATGAPATPTATPDTTAPMMGAKPQPSLLGRIGRVAARMGNIAGDILAPGITELIPGSDLNKRLEAKRAAATEEQKRKAGLEERRVGTEERRVGVEEEKEKREAATAGQPKEGLTPEETTLHDLMTGDNGKPRTNPDTGKPYEYLDAFTKVQEAKQGAKPAPKPSDEDKYIADFLSANKLPDTPQNRVRAQERFKTLGPFASAVAQAPEKGSERTDRSYQFNSGQLEKVRQPIDQLAQRMSNLVSNVGFKTPQADALLAPEILSLQAGGAGSGLRMNEAEISRIIGGATKWTQLQTALNKWSTDPAHASFTNEQRNQMRQIIQASAAKLSAKQTILEQGEQDLLDADDVKTHRQIVANTRKLLDAVDSGKKIIRKDGKIQIGE